MSTSNSASDSAIPVLFSPPSGKLKYEAGDFKRVCRSAPLALDDLPYYLLEEDVIPGWRPPRLWCGWLLGKAALFDIVKRQYPDRICYSRSHELLVATTVIDEFPKIICEVFQIPPEFHHLVKVVDAADNDGKVGMALTIGSTYKGTLPRDGDFIERLKRELFDGKEPEWVLCGMRWGWSKKRSAPKPKTQKTSYHSVTPPIAPTA
ncbi:hypothetical protein CPB85DRAFT_1571404 [Mucidula mucida]|nr:hypothetical protein CPB85DRAFT_1571404 [Mucidula mucida]